MTDPFIAAKAHAHRHLARNHLEHMLDQLERRLGLRRLPVRDKRGRFVKATR